MIRASMPEKGEDYCNPLQPPTQTLTLTLTLTPHHDHGEHARKEEHDHEGVDDGEPVDLLVGGVRVGVEVRVGVRVRARAGA